MDLVLSNEQKLIRDSATQLFRDRGGVGRLRALRDGKVAPNNDVWNEIAGLGWLAMTTPEALGGLGLGLAELCLVAEAAGRVLAPEPLVSSAVLANDALVMGASDAQKALWLPRLASGEVVGTVAWDERGMRGNIAKTASEGHPEGDHFVLIGAKQDVLAGAEAGLVIVSAKNSATSELELFVVDPKAPGMRVTPQQRIDSLPSARVALDGVVVRAADRLAGGAVGNGAKVLAAALDRATVVLSAELLGTASAAFEMTVAYLREREQFGVAIGTFQALRHRAAKLYIALELARSAVMTAARLLDAQARGEPAGMDPVAVAQTVSLAKARMSDTALLVADEAVQLHGGIGMTDEHDIGLYFKRARVAATTFGDGAYHRDRWASLGGY